MRLLWPLLKYLLFPLLLCWLFIVTLVVQAPIGWLAWKAQQHQLLPAGVSWQQLEGRIGKGQVTGLRVQGVELDSLRWSVPSWRLLLVIPRLDVRLISEQQDWLLQLNTSPLGSIKGHLQPGGMDVLRGQPLPISLQGQLQGQLDFAMQLQQGQLTCSDLQGELSGEVQVLQPMDIELGQVSFKPVCRTEQQLEWLFSSELKDQHQLQINGQMAHNTWSFTALADTQENAAITPILQLLQWRAQPGGRYSAQGSGRF